MGDIHFVMDVLGIQLILVPFKSLKEINLIDFELGDVSGRLGS